MVRVTIDRHLHEFLRTMPALCATEVHMLMQEKYESIYRIFNHDDPLQAGSRPLALVAQQWAEDTATTSTLYERIRHYHKAGVYKQFGLNLKDFFDMPSDICKEVLEISAKATAAESKTVNSMLQGLEDNKPGQ